MSNPTSNFNWQMPTATDLVTDLPADFEVFGQAVDTTFVDLKGGTTGQILSKASNTGMDFAWVTPPGGGKVLQVVSATYSTETQNATNTYADTNLTATITPTLATSKILALVGHHQNFKSSNSASSGVKIRLMRQATQLAEVVNLLHTGTAIQNHGALTFVFLDSPATTSAITYKTEFCNNANTSYVSVQVDNTLSSIVLLEIGA